MGPRDLVVCAALLMCGGCFYRVTDTTSGRKYIANTWTLNHEWSGALHFTDLKSGDEVEVQSWQAHEISRDEAKREIEAAHATPAAP